MLITTLLCLTLLRPCVNDVQFTVYEQETPDNVVFLMPGLHMNDEYWFRDISIYENYKNTLFIGVGHSDRLSEDLKNIISWVNANYDFPDRNQWSFCGYSSGAFELFEVVMNNYSSVFGNYGAFSGGSYASLSGADAFNYLYVCYGSDDVGMWSVFNVRDTLSAKGLITEDNYEERIIYGYGHCWDVALIGFQEFMEGINGASN